MQVRGQRLLTEENSRRAESESQTRIDGARTSTAARLAARLGRARLRRHFTRTTWPAWGESCDVIKATVDEPPKTSRTRVTTVSLSYEVKAFMR